MCFNPFHPMSVSLIKTFEWRSDNEVVGTYEYRNRLVPFVFDLLDKRYRVNSEIWLQYLEKNDKTGYLEMFDLVADYDFCVGNLSLNETGLSVEPLIIEPVVVTGCNPFPYGVVGPYTHVSRGQMGVSCCLYSRCSMPVDDEDDFFRDVTPDVRMGKDCSYLLYNCEYKMNKSWEPMNPHHFVKWYGDKVFKFYVRMQISDTSLVKFKAHPKFHNRNDLVVSREEGEDFYYYFAVNNNDMTRMIFNLRRYSIHKWDYVSISDYDNFVSIASMFRNLRRFKNSEVKFYSYPKNNNGGIIYDYRCVTLASAKKYEGVFHSFLPFCAPLPYGIKDDSYPIIDERPSDSYDTGWEGWNLTTIHSVEGSHTEGKYNNDNEDVGSKVKFKKK